MSRILRVLLRGQPLGALEARPARGAGWGRAAALRAARQARGLPVPVGRGPTVDLFDFKPVMRDLHGTELPDSVRGGQWPRG